MTAADMKDMLGDLAIEPHAPRVKKQKVIEKRPGRLQIFISMPYKLTPFRRSASRIICPIRRKSTPNRYPRHQSKRTPKILVTTESPRLVSFYSSIDGGMIAHREGKGEKTFHESSSR